MNQTRSSRAEMIQRKDSALERDRSAIMFAVVSTCFIAGRSRKPEDAAFEVIMPSLRDYQEHLGQRMKQLRKLVSPE